MNMGVKETNTHIQTYVYTQTHTKGPRAPPFCLPFTEYWAKPALKQKDSVV